MSVHVPWPCPPVPSHVDQEAGQAVEQRLVVLVSQPSISNGSCLSSGLRADAGGDPVSEPPARGTSGPGQQRGQSLCGVLPPGPAHGGDPAVPAQAPGGPKHQLQLQQR